MAAGGFRTFAAGETLDEDKINDFLMQGILVFADATARDAAITDPVHGQFCFLKDTDTTLFYDGVDWVEIETGGVAVEYVVIAGGGGGGGHPLGAGGGAGGYRSNVSGENSGGGVSAEVAIFSPLVPVTVTVGGGGAGGASGSGYGSSGVDSAFYAVTSIGGSGGGRFAESGLHPQGGSGGGAGGRIGSIYRFGAGIPTQGFRGGRSLTTTDGTDHSGGGGGAGAAGADNPNDNTGGDGGVGVSSSITGSATTRAGGGGGSGSTSGTGGAGGGGDGGNPPTAGTVNTGGGGGGRIGSGVGGAGGSGVVIIKYPDSVTLTIGAGLTSSTASAGGFKVTTFTQGTDTVTF